MKNLNYLMMWIKKKDRCVLCTPYVFILPIILAIGLFLMKGYLTYPMFWVSLIMVNFTIWFIDNYQIKIKK